MVTRSGAGKTRTRLAELPGPAADDGAAREIGSLKMSVRCGLRSRWISPDGIRNAEESGMAGHLHRNARLSPQIQNAAPGSGVRAGVRMMVRVFRAGPMSFDSSLGVRLGTVPQAGSEYSDAHRAAAGRRKPSVDHLQPVGAAKTPDLDGLVARPCHG